MPTVRKSAVAGTFYPDDPNSLQSMITQFLENTTQLPHHFRVIIAPHAGYIYSGQTAAHAYKQLETVKKNIKRVVLLGPAHRVPFLGLASSSADYFETPLGNIPLDRDAIQVLNQLPHININDQAHTQEHSLEVHLPFLQTILTDFNLIPLVVGDSDKESISDVIELFWHDPSTFVVISSDLSHFHEYYQAQSIDQNTANAIMNLKPEDISYEQACGRIPISGLLDFAQHHHLKATLLDLKNSGDTAGTRDNVVGYGAFGFE